jgi:salicylate hydroxylase
MAIEDAVGIATLLPLGTRPEDIPTRLQLYQSSRQPRVEMVLNFTRLNGRDENDTAGRRITRKSPSLPVSKITKMVGS